MSPKQPELIEETRAATVTARAQGFDGTADDIEAVLTQLKGVDRGKGVALLSSRVQELVADT